jgi:hypothetical protein
VTELPPGGTVTLYVTTFNVLVIKTTFSIIADNFDACHISSIRYDMTDTNIIQFKIMCYFLSHGRCLKNIRMCNSISDTDKYIERKRKFYELHILILMRYGILCTFKLTLLRIFYSNIQKLNYETGH